MMPGGFLITTDNACKKVLHNPVAAKFFRIDAWTSLSLSSLSTPPLRVYQNGKLVMPEGMPIQRAAWFGEEVNGKELEFVWQDGVTKTALCSASPLRNQQGMIFGAICTIEDVTHIIHMTKELEEHRLHLEVAKLERLNVIGQLAAGLAHEVRNPMTTIKGFLQLLQNKNDLLTYKSYFDLMIEELDRTNSIITDFLSLAKNKPTELKRQSLNEVLFNLFPLLQSDAFNQGKQFIFEPGDIVEIDIDPNEITQLVLNLARNGLEAMDKDGCLKIRTFIDGQNIVLSVKDEGTGINPEHITKLGIPFFTTKENGTGLGLPMCYSIADRHSALIDVKTSPNGTNFFVRFPQPKESNLT
jgi:signal transduction histidine kinase